MSRISAKRNPRLLLETLEGRLVPANAAFDLIGLTALRNDPSLSSINGSGITVAVIDSGVDYDHAKLSPAVYTDYDGKRVGVDFIDSAPNHTGSTYVFHSLDNNPNDLEGHGTHVAGIIAARDPDIGVAQGASIIGLRVADADGNITDANILRALAWVRDNASTFNIKVVNMSLGGGFFQNVQEDDPFAIKIQELEERGVTVVSAAGNFYSYISYDPALVGFPNNSPLAGKVFTASPAIGSTLNVGATYYDNSYSNIPNSFYGDYDFTTGPRRITGFSERPPTNLPGNEQIPNNPDNGIFAPGAFITSTVPNFDTSSGQVDNLTAVYSGTSQAAPMVSGVVALVQDAALNYGGRYLTPAEVKSVIRTSGTSILDGDDEDDSVLNTKGTFKFINALNAVNQVKALFDTPNAADDPNGTLGSAVSLYYDFTAPISISSDLGTDGGLVDNNLDSKSGAFTQLTGPVAVGAKDVDFYKIHFGQAGRLFAQVTDDKSGANPVINAALRVFDSAGNQLALNEDSDPFDDNNGKFNPIPKVSVNLAAGDYYVAVSGCGNTNYNPNIELSGKEAINTLPGAPTGVSPTRPFSGTGNYRLTVAFDVVDPNGILDGAVETPVEVGGVAVRQGFLGADIIPGPTDSNGNAIELFRPNQFVISSDILNRQGVLVDADALTASVNGTQTFRSDSTGLPATDVLVDDVDLFITTAPASGFIAFDIDSKQYTNVPLIGGGFGSVAADTRLRAWRVEDNGTLTPLADTNGNFSNDDGSDPFDPFDSAQNATFDSFFQVRVSAGDRIVFGVSNWLNSDYTPLTTVGRQASGTSSVGFYDAFITYRSGTDLDGRIGSDIANLDKVSKLTVPSTSAGAKNYPISQLPDTVKTYSIGTDRFDSTPVGPLDVDFYWYTPSQNGTLFVNVNATPGAAKSANTVLTVYELAGKVDFPDSANPGFGVATATDLTANPRVIARVDDLVGSDGSIDLNPNASFPVTVGNLYYIAISGSGNNSFDPFRYASGSPARPESVGSYDLESSFSPQNQVIEESPVQPLPPTKGRRPYSGNLGFDTGLDQRAGKVLGADVDAIVYNPSASGEVSFVVNPSADSSGRVPNFQVFGKAPGATVFTAVTGLVNDGQEKVAVSKGTTYKIAITNGAKVDIAANGTLSVPGNRSTGASGNYLFSIDDSSLNISLTAPASATFKPGVASPVPGTSLTASSSAGTGVTYTVTASVGSGTLISGTASGASLKFTGTLAEVNAKLAALNYKSVAHQTAAAAISLNASSSNGASSTATVNAGIQFGTAYAAADPELAGKTSLFVQGTTGADNITVASLNASSYRVTLNGTQVTISGITGRILGYLLAGDDTFDSKTTTIANRIYGGEGNDIVLTGSAADAIFGEAGNDLLAGGLGADVIKGGAGKDILVDGSIAQKGARTLRQSLDAYVALPASATAAQYNSLASFLTFTKDSASRDTLDGEADIDLFFAALATDIVGRAAVENFRSA